jgi:uncharacterized protein with ParB-like and HNH nuclease domain
MTIDAKHTNIRSLIMDDTLSQFHIPIYQRNYTWDAYEQVDKLIKDIIEFGKEYKENKNTDYYIGNIIVKNQHRPFMIERIVIDGQQRITTTILMLCAIRDIYLKKNTEESRRSAKRIAKALFSEEDEELKLKLNNMEHQKTLESILTGSVNTISSTEKKTNYWKNYQHIYKELDKMEEEEFNNFVTILDRVKVVIIVLDDNQDENSVFESINAHGKHLSGPDLIKNFLFTFKNYKCSRQEEKTLTDIYTKKFESLFFCDKPQLIEERLQKFFREYIALKIQKKVNDDPKVIYYSFKKLVGDIREFNECKELIDDITKWGIIYQILLNGSHADIDKNHLEYLRPNFLTYATLLMDIVEKYSYIEEDDLIVKDKHRLNEALKKVVVYDVCRLLGDMPIKEITRFIPTIPKKLERENKEYYQDYAKAFESLVTSTLEGYKQPKTSLLKRRVIDTNVYKKTKQTLRFLILIENIGKKELLSYEQDSKGCQIEHIMPQSLPATGWDGISESNHEKYLHTLGNLSITFDNQSLSNKSFLEKKKILAEKSRINLNQGLLKYEKFDEISIEARSLELLDLFVNAYGLKYDIDNHEDNTIILSMTYKNITAYATLKGHLFVVKKGSKATLSNQNSLQEALRNKKNELIDKRILIEDEDALVFSENYPFTSPSMAASIITGSSVNGKLLWKLDSGESLSDICSILNKSDIDQYMLSNYNKMLEELEMDGVLNL